MKNIPLYETPIIKNDSFVFSSGLTIPTILVLAAPSLLEAAKEQYENMRVIADLTARKWTIRDQSCFEKLGAAIAKAEGGH